MAKAFTIRPDSKGRITLGRLARGVSSLLALGMNIVNRGFDPTLN